VREEGGGQQGQVPPTLTEVGQKRVSAAAAKRILCVIDGIVIMVSFAVSLERVKLETSNLVYG